MSAKIDVGKLATVRMEFLSGASLRQLAEKHGLSLRTLAGYSQREGWEGQRQMQRSASALPDVIAAADARCEAVAGSWRDQIEPICDLTVNTIARASEILASDKLKTADFKELATLIKIMADALGKLRELAPVARLGSGKFDAELAAMTDAELEAMIRGEDHAALAAQAEEYLDKIFNREEEKRAVLERCIRRTAGLSEDQELTVDLLERLPGPAASG